MRYVRLRPLVELAGPVALVVAVALAASFTSAATAIELRNAIVNVAIVVALYVFVGNSGIISFGHASFVAVGAFAAGVMTVPADVKPGVLSQLFPLLKDHSLSNAESLLLAAGVGGVYAFVVGLPLMRLTGLAAGIATFAVLGITHNILRYWTKIGPGAQQLSLVPETSDLWQLAIGAAAIIAAALAYQRSRWGRQLRAVREDSDAARATGVNIYRQRLIAFTISGALSGFAGGLLIHLLGSINTEQVYLELTFLTLAMLVVGGVSSLFGAVVGALGVSLLDTFLSDAEEGVTLFSWTIDLPGGSRLVGVAAVMLLLLLVRPSGLTGGREFGRFRLPRPRLRRAVATR